MGLIRILSIDGGGIRGIIPSKVIVTLEQLLQKHSGRKDARIADYFDLVAGTSIGGILTAMYLCPDKNNYGRPKFSAEEVVNILNEKGEVIFSKSILQEFITGFGLFGTKYSDKNIGKSLDQYLEDIKLSQLIKPCLITAYDIERHSTVFFNQMSAKQNSEKDFFVKDVVRATSAAPIYFPVANIKSLGNVEYALIDGGVFANNPAICAYAESSKLKSNSTIKDIMILSIGTGEDEVGHSYNRAKNWGAIQWAIPILKILMDGVAETVDYQLRNMFDSVNKSSNYLRIQGNLKDCSIESFKIDDCSKNNINDLNKIGDDLAKNYYKKLDNFAKLLVAQ